MSYLGPQSPGITHENCQAESNTSTGHFRLVKASISIYFNITIENTRNQGQEALQMPSTLYEMYLGLNISSKKRMIARRHRIKSPDIFEEVFDKLQI